MIVMLKRFFRKVLPFAVVLLLVSAISLSLSGCGPVFDGSCVKDTEAYALDMERMTGTDTHTIELEKGDRLSIRFVTDEGFLSLKVTAPDGTIPYQGNGSAAEEFTLNLSQSGTYTLHVEGHRWKGSLHVDVEK